LPSRFVVKRSGILIDVIVDIPTLSH